MADKPTVLGLMSKQLDRIEENQDNMLVCLGNINVRQENFEGRLTNNTEMIRRHVDNKERHYNPYYSETLPQKMWRKKSELTASGILVTIITLLIEHYLGG